MPSTDDARSRFAQAADTASRRTALIELIWTKQLHAVAADAGFRRGLAALAATVRDDAGKTDGTGTGRATDPNEAERLLAVATLRRAAAAAKVKSLQTDIRTLLRGALTRPLAQLHALSDSDDRYYAAGAWRDVDTAWRLDDLAAAAVGEASGEKARLACIEGLVAGAADLREVMAALRKALPAVVATFGTKQRGDSLGRRLTRVLAAVSKAVAARPDTAVGAQTGRELGLILDREFRATGRPASEKVKTDLVDQVAALTHEIARRDAESPHGPTAKTFDALAVAADWFTPAAAWERVAASSKAVARVRDDLERALQRLAEAGRTDDDLRRALATAAGSRARAEAICRRLATEAPGLPAEVRDWLAGARRRTRIASTVESQERSIDEVLGELLLEQTKLARASSRVRSDVLPDVSAMLPQSVRPVSQLAGFADAMVSKLRLVMKWRSLRVRGAVGDEVEFSPREHRFDDAGVRARRVRLLTPIVERLSEDGVPRVVLKAAVEPAPDRPPGPAR